MQDVDNDSLGFADENAADATEVRQAFNQCQPTPATLLALGYPAKTGG